MVQLIIFTVTIVIAVILIRYAGKSKSKWGINFKRVYCPVCNTKQPIIRTPDSSEQALWGGTTCPKCQTKLDKYGAIQN